MMAAGYRQRGAALRAAGGATVVLLGVLGLVSVPTVAAGAPLVSVAVVGNHLVDGAGHTIRLFGVDRSGTEYACEQGWGIFDGPSDAASVAAMAAWHINAVRIPLNEGCWLDQYTVANDPFAASGDPAPYEGAAYQSAIGDYVTLLHSYGIAAILDLAVPDVPDSLNGDIDAPMADSQYSPSFWSSVASYFKSDPGVLYDLYNEPYDISWSCWDSGCPVTWVGGTYQTAGMQQLVDAVRNTGAAQPLMLGGLDYSSDEADANGSWLADMPSDPDHSLMVSFHTYNTTNCNTATCWDNTLVPLAAVVPVVTGEFGEYDCATSYSNAYMKFADAEGISYLGWAWDAIAPGSWQCDGPSLITDYDGTPSDEGIALQTHLETLYAEGQIPPFGSAVGPPVTAVSPTSGPGAGGTKVRITGSGFKGTTSVEFGSSNAASFTVNGPGTSIVATAPPQSAGTVAITVNTPSGSTATSGAEQYTYLAPTIRTVNPASGAGAGGKRVTILGSDLNGATSVAFGSTPATQYAVNGGGTSIAAYAPPHVAGAVTITVTTPGGTPGIAYTYLAPVVTSLKPTTGPATGGTRVMIRGADLNGASSVWFGSIAATSLTVSAAGTSITAYAPAGTPGSVPVTVTTPGGTSLAVPAAQFTYS